MLLTVFLDIFHGKSKVNEKYLRVFIQVSVGIDHYVFEFHIVERPFRTMHVLEDVHQLAGDIDNPHYLLHSFKFAQIFFEVHLIEWHDEVCHIYILLIFKIKKIEKAVIEHSRCGIVVQLLRAHFTGFVEIKNLGDLFHCTDFIGRHLLILLHFDGQLSFIFHVFDHINLAKGSFT